MSDDICGCVEIAKNKTFIEQASRIEKKYDIGITKIDNKYLCNYPVEFLPQGNYFAFSISETHGYVVSSYFLDPLDYAPEADIGLPIKADERLALLISILIDIVLESETKRMLLSLCDSSQIEHIKSIKFSELSAVIYRDVKESYGPPNILYQIIVD